MAGTTRSRNYNVKFKAKLDTTELDKQIKQYTSGTGNMAQATKQGAGILGNFNKQLSNLGVTIGKVAKFGIATAAIGAFTSGLRSAVDAVFELDAALVEFKKVSDLSGDALDNYVEKATKLGETVAMTGAQMIEAATMFRKSGFDDDMSLKLAEEASLFRNIADSEISAADASSFLIATMKAFNIEAKDTREILDETNQVANEFAVSTTDLSTALPKVAATMSQAGNSLSETIALLTAAMEVMPNQASRVARGFRSITLNLQGLTDEGEESQELVSKMESNFNKLGLTLMGSDGQLKSTYEIFSDLASIWDTLDRNTQNYYAALIGGKTQVDVVNSTLTNFSTALKANETAMNSSGSATRENARYMESLEAKLQALKSEWQELTNQDGIIDKFIRLILGAGTAVLDFANNDMVQTLPKIAALTAGISGITAVIANFGDIVKKVSVALKSFALNNPILLGVTALVAAFYGLSKVDKSLETIDDLTSKIDENSNKLAENRAEIEELEASRETLSASDERRLEALKKENAELEKNNKLLAERRLKKLEEQESQNGKVVGYGTRGGGMGVDVQRETQMSIAQAELENAKSLDDLTEATVEWLDETVAAAAEAEEYGVILDENTKKVTENYLALKKAQEQQVKTTSTTATSVAALKSQDAELIKTFESMQDLVQAEQQLRNGQALSEEQIRSLIAKYPTLINNIEAMRKGELSAAEAIHAVGVQSLGTSKTVIANSKAEADSIIKNSQAEIKALIAKLTALEAVKLASGDTRREVEQTASYQSILRSLGEVQQALRDAQALSAFYADAEYYGTAVTTGNTSSTKANTSAKEELADTEEELAKAIKETTDALKEEAQQIENAADFMISRLDDEIDKLEAQKKAIEGTNKELEDQLELQEALDALAKAKSRKVLVYQGGQFTYSADASAIGEAQQRVDEIRRKQAQQAQLDDIENQINAIKTEQDAWRAVKDAYNEYLGAQQLGVSVEGNAWKQRINQAKDYAQEYIKLMGAVAGVESGAISLSEGQNILSSSGVNKNPTTVLDRLPQGFSRNVITQWALTGVSPVATALEKAQGGTKINIANVSLPNVTDADGFVTELENFNVHAKQASAERKA